MPQSAPKPCKSPGCAALVTLANYCERHRKDERQWDSPQRNRRRRAKRALSYTSAAWQSLRRSVLTANPLCVYCQQQGRVREAKVVDHINADASDNRLSNLQGLCISCHNRKTARHDGGFGNRRQSLSGKS